jgi:Cu(I)/Ag(I) efflux system periplasmic protein CusF
MNLKTIDWSPAQCVKAVGYFLSAALYVAANLAFAHNHGSHGAQVAQSSGAASAPATAAPASKPAAASTTSNTAMADGEVRKIDKEGGKITLKHGEIKSLDMPPMTMVFQVKDKTLLEKVQMGDKVKFIAVSEGSRYVVTEMMAVK